jgi:uncharacterized protein (DUF697 family)
MNKKRLPKAIIRSSDEVVAAGVACAASEPPQLLTDLAGRRDARALQRASEVGENVIAMAPSEARSARSVDELPGPALPHVSSDDERRSAAAAIVHRHAAYSAAGGIIPLPVANFAGVVAVIIRMVKMLSSHYGVPFERNRARTIVVALVGGAMPMGVATLTTSALIYVLPPSAIVALAASSITAATFTRSVGRIFIEHFERGATLQDLLTE